MPEDKFTLEVKLGNAEMNDGTHIATALREVADRVDGVGLGDVEGRIRDVNGNTVGKYEGHLPGPDGDDDEELQG